MTEYAKARRIERGIEALVRDGRKIVSVSELGSMADSDTRENTEKL